MFFEYPVLILRHKLHRGSIELCLYTIGNKLYIPGKYQTPFQRTGTPGKAGSLIPVIGL